MYVVCGKTKLMGLLLDKESKVPLLVRWTKQGKVLTSNDAIERAIKKKVLFVFNCLHGAMTTHALFPRRFGSRPSISLDPQRMTA